MQASLTIYSGKDVGRQFVIRMGQVFVLGRGRNVTIRLDDEMISRKHAQVELTPGGLRITDMGSRNGTYLAGKKIPSQAPQLAAPKDTLQIGAHIFNIEVTGMDEGTRRLQARTQRLEGPLLSPDEFEVLGEIGRGATGRIYAAHQKLLGRNLAIKVLRTEVSNDLESKERFLREGRICCLVKSPYVVEVYDIRIVRGRVHLLMELVNGLSAKDMFQGGPLQIPQALKIGEDVGKALDAAHRVGVIHRDIKPANILITPQATAKLSDFGIAKELNSVESLTSTGEGLGTMAYVSPEQATEAKTVGPRTDIYSLGATLYHLIAGQPPFLPLSARVLLEILDQPPPPIQSLRPECPAEIGKVIHKMLEKEPNNRPPHGLAVAEALSTLRKKFYPGFGQQQALSESKWESTDEFMRPGT